MNFQATKAKLVSFRAFVLWGQVYLGCSFSKKAGEVHICVSTVLEIFRIIERRVTRKKDEFGTSHRLSSLRVRIA